MYRRDKSRWIKHIDFIIIDLICMELSFFLSFYIRHGELDIIKTELYMETVLILILINLVAVLILDTFKNVLKRGSMVELNISVKQVILVEAIACVYIFITKTGSQLSRQTFLVFPFIYLALSYITRLVWKVIILKNSHFKSAKNFFVICTKDRIEHAIGVARKKHYGKFNIVGLAVVDENMIGQKIDNEEVVAYRDDILDFLKNKWIDEVFVSVNSRGSLPVEVLPGLVDMGLVTHIEIVNLDNITGNKCFVEKISDGTYITTSINTVSTLDAFIKRLIDIIIGIIGCIFTGIFAIILAPLIKRESPGPLLFKQKRVGRNGKTFDMYKFRSMYMDAEERKAELMKNNNLNSDIMFKMEKDPRIIGSRLLPDGTYKKGIGNRIRDWSIDEFPQFINVLKGDMSLIGTRPPTLDEWEKYNLNHRARLAIKPGLTGLWQVSGRSNIKDFEQVVELDRQYIMEWSFILDIKIFFKTILVVLKKEGSF